MKVRNFYLIVSSLQAGIHPLTMYLPLTESSYVEVIELVNLNDSNCYFQNLYFVRQKEAGDVVASARLSLCAQAEVLVLALGCLRMSYIPPMCSYDVILVHVDLMLPT